MEVNPINDWEITDASNVVNLVIVGKAGNGKSATGNSILGREAFFSDFSSSGVTSTSDLQETVLMDGRIVKVIDTPGLFDFSNPAVVSREIIKCMDLAKDGIHAVLMVFSITTRFTKEEEAAVESMKSLFGDKIVKYMILVFTGGDSLESRGKSLRDYSRTFSVYLKNLIELCDNRLSLFDNTTNDTSKREEQVNKLLSLVESVISENDGKPYSDKSFAEVKESAQKIKELEPIVGCSVEENSKLYVDQLKLFTEMLEEKLKFVVERLAEAERLVEETRKKSELEIQTLTGELNNNRTESEELKRRVAELPKCAIL